MWLGIFQPGRKELAHLGKWQNEKQLKVGSKKVESRSLERRKIKGQPSRTPQNGKVNWGFSKIKSQKEEIMKNKEETSHQCCWHNIAFGTQKSKNRRNHGTLETLGCILKGKHPKWKAFSNSELEQRSLRKLYHNSKKREKWGKYRSVSSSSH